MATEYRTTEAVAKKATTNDPANASFSSCDLPGIYFAGDAVAVAIEAGGLIAVIAFVERCHSGIPCCGAVFVVRIGTGRPAPSNAPVSSAPPMAAVIIFFTVFLFLSRAT